MELTREEFVEVYCEIWRRSGPQIPLVVLAEKTYAAVTSPPDVVRKELARLRTTTCGIEKAVK